MGMPSYFWWELFLLATIALMTPYPTNLMGYPVLTAGLVLAPRGVEHHGAMMVVGRLINRIDPRIMVFIGFSLVCDIVVDDDGFYAGYFLCPHRSYRFDSRLRFGLRLCAVWHHDFATLEMPIPDPRDRFVRLMRNLGSSTGISLGDFPAGPTHR